MSLLQAILMGVIQGLTEFLPVSSSGHLALFKILFGVETETGILYDVLLHVGTLLAICVVYYRDLGRLIVEGVGILRDIFANLAVFFRNTGKSERKKEPYQRVICNSYRKLVVLLLVSTIPTGVIGFFGRDVVDMASEILIVPGICLIVTAVLLLIADRVKDRGKLPKNVTYTDAFGVGIAQGIATLPGLSRSGTTITACLLSGYQRNFAVKYSFLMSIPAILGALVLQLKDIAGTKVTGAEISYYIIGMLIAAVIGYVCIKTMLVVVRKKKFTIFAIYCFLIGALSIGGYFYAV
ncbi:MAG: undecaprenyl-diphosphate phosphatase [Roseburia sp.]|jgi:undecaprenyl-diphosphatase|nr:undecaprenyl-diphosphate phosphatase [Roseburia sp.]